MDFKLEQEAMRLIEQCRLVDQHIEELEADKARLNWLEKQFGCGLIHDDNGAWAFATTGYQSIRMEPDEDLETGFIIEAELFRPTIREAIDHGIAEFGEEE